MMKTVSTFEADIQKKVYEKQFEEVLELLKNPENDTVIRSNIWNLINTVCLTIKTNKLLDNDSNLELCKSILLTLADRGTPKEIIVALMEEADSFKTNTFFCLLLDPLKTTLKKVPGKRGKSLEWVLSTLNAHMQTLPLPQDLDLQGEEKLLLDTDPAVTDAEYVLAPYLDFLNEFIDEVSFVSLQESDYFIERVMFQREILQKHILMVLDRPLLYHDLHVESQNRPKSTIQTLCENYVKSLSKVCCNVYNLFNYDESGVKKVEDEEDDSELVPCLAFSNLAYLIFVEKLAAEWQPLVYSHRYLFTKYLNYVTLLLEKKENLVLFKGLHLSQTLLDRLEDLELLYDFVELDIFTKFPKLLLNIAIYSQIEVHRSMAIQMFLLYISKCDWKGRYHLINQVLDTVKHSGAEGLVINLYKTYLHSCLNGRIFNTYFLGKNLKLFLKKVFILQDGVETDILENSDRIITSLNLLRYLLLKDRKNKNETGIWDLISIISEKFLDPLSIGLDLSRAHYKQVAKENADDLKNQQKRIKSTVSVNNELLPNIQPNFQKELYEKALLTFDMVESVMSRVRELLC